MLTVRLEDNHDEDRQPLPPQEFTVGKGDMLLVGSDPSNLKGRESVLGPLLAQRRVLRCRVMPNDSETRLSKVQLAIYYDDTDQARILHLGRPHNRTQVQRFGEQARFLALPPTNRSGSFGYELTDGDRLSFASTVWLPFTRMVYVPGIGYGPESKRLSIVNAQAYVDEFGSPSGNPLADWAGNTHGPAPVKEPSTKAYEAFIHATGPLLQFPAVRPDVKPAAMKRTVKAGLDAEDAEAMEEREEAERLNRIADMMKYFQGRIEEQLGIRPATDHRMVATLFAEQVFSLEDLVLVRQKANGEHGPAEQRKWQPWVVDTLADAANLLTKIDRDVRQGAAVA